MGSIPIFSTNERIKMKIATVADLQNVLPSKILVRTWQDGNHRCESEEVYSVAVIETPGHYPLVVVVTTDCGDPTMSMMKLSDKLEQIPDDSSGDFVHTIYLKD